MRTVATKFWCDLLGVPVYDAHYFKGTIQHERIDSPARAGLVAFAPLTVNTLLCAILLFPVSFAILLGSDLNYPNLILSWVGISVGVHTLPSASEIAGYLQQIPEDRRHGVVYYVLRALEPPLVLISFLKFLWFDFIYALLVGMAAPFAITYLYMALQEN
jgi:hypothetical protein